MFAGIGGAGFCKCFRAFETEFFGLGDWEGGGVGGGGELVEVYWGDAKSVVCQTCVGYGWSYSGTLGSQS